MPYDDVINSCIFVSDHDHDDDQGDMIIVEEI